MRTNRALQNTFFSIASYVILMFFGFLTQRIFKDVLGTEYLGINSLFSNIISGLNIVELGFGSAIVANMYKPVAENDIDSINSLLKFYKRIYEYIAFIILIVGLCILPFIGKIVGKTNIEINLYIIFSLYLFDSVVSYFLTYKRSILYANQQSYYISIVHTFIVSITNVLQINLMLSYRNFYVYLVVSIILKIIENIVINYIVYRKYPNIDIKGAKTLEREMITDIKRKVHGLLFHKISTFVVLGTDNIIISMVPSLGIFWVGLYSSYSLLTSKITSLVDTIFNSITASVGNLLVQGEKDKEYGVFKNIKLVNCWIYVFVATSFYYVSFPFVELWMGKNYVLDSATVLIITINLFIGGLRASYGMFKNAAGIFFEDRYVPIIESITNIVCSIPFAFLWGLKGVILGTICSTVVLFIFSYPKFVYKKIFNKSYKQYFIDLIKPCVQFGLIMIITFIVTIPIHKFNHKLQLIMNIIACLIVPNLMMFLINIRSNEMAFIFSLCKRLLKRTA